MLDPYTTGLLPLIYLVYLKFKGRSWSELMLAKVKTGVKISF